ncbi:DUF2163 domain-containing protein [Aquibaculum arenosum]|uniref:DUF2163 domain-containing protein n=1 Tax=Aquibaculum arenosum TaxID=3032591 RepID=A0ABT5YR02_9PROT|nr:DUF2163 domain-containing protein [Fodinicurvata sp. CAU 1616]MDF2097319.1 DUF2163 domain-containing protein [Fodinicurvata sp. CAU 1616]
MPPGSAVEASYGGLVRWTPSNRPGSLARFDARYWNVDFSIDPPIAAAVISDGSSKMTVHAVARQDRDFVGLIWESEDRWSHPLHRYEAQPSYRNVTLRFRWIGSADSKALDGEDGPVITLETYGGPAHYIRLWNHRVLPNPNADDDDPRDQVIEITFDEALLTGFNPPDPSDPDVDPDLVEAARAPLDQIKRLFFSIVPQGYVDDPEHDPEPLASEVDFWVTIEDIACTSAGPGGVTQLKRVTANEPLHSLRMTDGYDNAYHLTPARVVQQAWQLGYRSEWVLYMGISHFHNLTRDGSAWRVDPAAPGLNAPTVAWLQAFCAELEDRGYALWLSVSFEVLATYIPQAWAQRNYADEVALTGWSPPSSLIAPTSAAGLAWLAKVAIHCLDIATDAGLAPRFQIGEPWWWDGSFTDQAPHIYDFGTLQAYNNDTGNFAPTPRLKSVFEPVGPHGPYLDWCREQLGTATQTLLSAVRAEHATVETALLLFTPQVFRPDSAILTRLNFPATAWEYPAFDVLQIEDYDWVFEGRFDLTPKTWEVARDDLGYPLSAINYFAGFVLNERDAYQWRHIERAIREAFDHSPAEVFVWSREQVLRDGWTVGADRPWVETQAPRLTRLATCWRVERRDGAVLGFTTHDRELTFGNLTYVPAVSFQPTEVRARSDLSPGALEALGGFSAEEISEADLRAGLYDGAEVTIWQVDWADPSAERRLLARGTIGEVSADTAEGGFRAELRGMAGQLAQPIGEVYQPLCRADLGDARCGVNLGPLTVATTVTALGGGGPFEAADPRSLELAASVADGAYNYGLLTFTGGANQGLAFEIAESDGGRVHLFERPPHDVALGDAVTIVPGCDKTLATCRERYSNLVNFRGDAVLRPVRRS